MPTDRWRSWSQPGTGLEISRAKGAVKLLAVMISAVSVLSMPSPGFEEKQASPDLARADISKTAPRAGSTTAKPKSPSVATPSSTLGPPARCADNGSDKYAYDAQAQSTVALQDCCPIGLRSARASDRASPAVDHCLPVAV